jgi:hypothetical protein
MRLFLIIGFVFHLRSNHFEHPGDGTGVSAHLPHLVNGGDHHSDHAVDARAARSLAAFTARLEAKFTMTPLMGFLL